MEEIQEELEAVRQTEQRIRAEVRLYGNWVVSDAVVWFTDESTMQLYSTLLFCTVNERTV